jgi:hypothetical protein
MHLLRLHPHLTQQQLAIFHVCLGSTNTYSTFYVSLHTFVCKIMATQEQYFREMLTDPFILANMGDKGALADSAS